MRDVFYTILVVWILYRIMDGVNSMRPRRNDSPGPATDSEPASKKKNPIAEEGEYVDFEEIK
ncbi:MAG: hypothetical protein ACJ77K_10425 [Bacteroidia bacterium]